MIRFGQFLFLLVATGLHCCSTCYVAAFAGGQIRRTKNHPATLLNGRLNAAVTSNDVMSSILEEKSSDEDDDTKASEKKGYYDTLLKTIQTRQVHPDVVFDSMLRLEKMSYRERWTQSKEVAARMAESLKGDFRPVFSSGTPITQKRLGGHRLNYFPIKAVISLLPEEGKIQNGLYFGDYYLIRLDGTCVYEPKLRRFRFSFHNMRFFNGAFKIDFAEGQDVEFATTVGLGGKIGLWNILLADENMMMARGAGQAITLWKRQQGHRAEWW